MIPLLEPMLSDFKTGTVAWLIQRYVEEMASMGLEKRKSHEQQTRLLRRPD